MASGRVVAPAKHANLLGVILDQHLEFEQHLWQVDKKCTNGLQAIASLGRSKWGLSLEEKHLVYNTYIAPCALSEALRCGRCPGSAASASNTTPSYERSVLSSSERLAAFPVASTQLRATHTTRSCIFYRWSAT